VAGYASVMAPTPHRPVDDDGTAPRGPVEFGLDDAALPLVATAIHAGHDLRAEVAEWIALDDSARLREEDPCTDRIIAPAPARVVVNRSRFEVDLNRARDGAVYRLTDETWGQDVWKAPLPDDVVQRSLAEHDEFYESLAERLDRLAARGPFVVLDVHSYNHRREGPEAPPAPAEENPALNVGTGSLDRERWAPVVDTLISELGGSEVRGEPLDVRENVRFEGAHLAGWVHERYPTTGCALALEFKKTFMNEWSGRVDEQHLDELTAAVASTLPAVVDAVAGERR
jgi:N-formylglutamate deformylase